MDNRERTILTGSRFSSPRTMQQLDYSIGLGLEELALLAKYGFPEAKLNELKHKRAEIGKLYADQSVAKQDVPMSSADLRTAVLDAKAWKRMALLFAANAIDDRETLDDFEAGGTLGESVPRLVAYLTRVVPLVEKHAAAFQEWGAPADFAARGRDLLEKVRAKDVAQELKVGSLPETTARLYQLKGEAYALLKKFNRCGRVLHDGDARKAARYNLDILNRRATGPGSLVTPMGGATG